MEYAHAQGLSFPGELEHGIERWIVTFRTAGPLKIDSFFIIEHCMYISIQTFTHYTSDTTYNSRAKILEHNHDGR